MILLARFVNIFVILFSVAFLSFFSSALAREEILIKYVHTNIIAKNWRNLSKFYIEVFGCKPVYPERNLSGRWLEDITKIKGTKIRGIHLILPGYENEPTLEIFEYIPQNPKDNEHYSLNMQGFGHIAFHVSNVDKILKKLVVYGGKTFGKVVRRKYPELGKILTVTYAKDPEGNFIELQNWEKY